MGTRLIWHCHDLLPQPLVSTAELGVQFFRRFAVYSTHSSQATQSTRKQLPTKTLHTPSKYALKCTIGYLAKRPQTMLPNCPSEDNPMIKLLTRTARLQRRSSHDSGEQHAREQHRDLRIVEDCGARCHVERTATTTPIILVVIGGARRGCRRAGGAGGVQS